MMRNFYSLRARQFRNLFCSSTEDRIIRMTRFYFLQEVFCSSTEDRIIRMDQMSKTGSNLMQKSTTNWLKNWSKKWAKNDRKNDAKIDPKLTQKMTSKLTQKMSQKWPKKWRQNWSKKLQKTFCDFKKNKHMKSISKKYWKTLEKLYSINTKM